MKIILRMLVFLYLMFSLSDAIGQNKIDFWLKDILSRQKVNPEKLSQMQDRGVKFDKTYKAPMVEVIIQSSGQDFKFVESMGGRLRTVVGDYATALIPLSNVEKMAALSQVKYISGAIKEWLLNDIATQVMGIDDAIQAGYTGENVIVGVVDTGIDIHHPGFKNDNGSRILYLWDQTQTGSSPSAPSFDYGTEWRKSQIDNGECTSKDTDGHGTHVAGSIAQFIAAGPDSAYDGGAIAANLVIVKTDLLSTHILDGVNYIFEKARQLGKPAVVNLSLGSQNGPHDGSDPVTAARDLLAGPGRIIVQSAGNDGANPIHHQVSADANGEDMEFTVAKTASKLEFELWYDGAENVTIRVLGPGNVPDFTLQPGQSGKQTTNQGNATVDNASAGSESYNGDKRISVILENSVAAGTWKFRLSSVSATTVHAWMWDGDPEAGFAFSTSDNHYTLTNGACGKNVIAVGAMVTRNRVRVRDVPGIPDGTEVSVNEVIDEIATFSSGGPTRDGRHKPEVVAPGVMVISALSEDIQTNGNGSFGDFRSYGDRLPVFGLCCQQSVNGTSVSGPLLAGGLPTLLESNEALDDDAIRAMFRKDAKNAQLAVDNTWHYRKGYGLFDLRNFLNQQTSLIAVKQTAGDKIDIQFNVILNGADNKNHYQIVGPSAASVTIENAGINDKTVTLDLSGNLVEGFRDSIMVTGITGLAESAIFEIDKLGTVVTLTSLLTKTTWRREDSPYYIHNSLQIGRDVSLTLQPGTTLKFMPNAEEPVNLVIFGELNAHGAVEKPITFTSLNESLHGEWGGLFFDADIPSTTLKHCRIQYAEIGVICRSSNLTLENCMILHSYDTGFLVQNCSPKIKRTVIWDSNGGQFDDGIQLSNVTSSSVIENVTIVGNGRAGIACFSSNPQIINAVVVSNAQLGIHSQDGIPPTVTYSDVWNNGIDFNGVSGAGAGNISVNPLFENAAAGDFQLSADSPCIDAGSPDSQFNDPDGTVNDMGAFDRLADLVVFDSTKLIQGYTFNWQTISTDSVKGVIVVRSFEGPPDIRPLNGKQYQVEDALGNGVIIQSVLNGSHSGNFIDENERAYFSAWAIYSGFNYSDKEKLLVVSINNNEPEGTIPLTYRLHQNYPNPFNPETEIQFELPKQTRVQIKVFNVLGQEIKTLLDSEYQPGVHKIRWDGKDRRGNLTAAGVYLYRIKAGDFTSVKKMLLLR